MAERGVSRQGRRPLMESMERENYVVRRVREGARQVEIAQELGISQPAVSQIWTRALRELPEKTVDEYRALMMAENREHIDKLQEIIYGDHPYVQEGRVVFPIERYVEGAPVYGDRPLQDVGPVLKAISTAVTLHKRLSDWIGADAAKKSEVVTAHVSAEDLRVTQLVRGISSGNAVREEAIRARVMARRALPPGASVGAGGRPHGAREHRERGLRVMDRVLA
jgi:hypothetical protein